MIGSDKPPFPLPLETLVFCTCREDLSLLGPEQYACVFPEILDQTGSDILSEEICRKKSKGIVLLTGNRKRIKEWDYRHRNCTAAVDTLSSLGALVGPEEKTLLTDRLMVLLGDLTRRRYYSPRDLGFTASLLFGLDLCVLMAGEHPVYSSHTAESLPFREWAEQLADPGEQFFHHTENPWCGNLLTVQNRPLGYLFHREKSQGLPLNQTQRRMLLMHFLLACLGEGSKPAQTERLKEEFLFSVIYGLNKDLIHLKKEASLHTIPFSQLRYIWVLRMERPASSGDSLMDMDSILALCRKAFPRNIFLSDGRLVISIHEKDGESDESAARKTRVMIGEIEALYPGTHCTIGNSRAYPSLNELRHAYQDALFSLRVSDIIYGKTRDLVTYNDLLIYHFLFDQKENPIIKRLYSNSIKTLRQFDEEFKEQLLLTVTELIKQEFGISETARHLGLHRNTLYHRMEKIETLTGINLKSQEGRLLLQLGMKLDQIMEVGRQSG